MKKNSPLIILFFAISTLLHAQDLDSLFNLYRSIKSTPSADKPAVNLSASDLKCAFGIAGYVHVNFDNFSSSQQELLTQLFQAPQMQASRITPGGYFNIHYDTTGVNAVGFDLDAFSAAADSAYEYEVFTLNYPPPPAAVSGAYDVYLQNLGSGFYGYTEPDENLGGEKYSSHIVIDNDFSFGYASDSINGAKVTIAHELHHAIQMGNYIFRTSDIFYYEITSTAMEEFVFDYVNDYYAYMDDYFDNTAESFSLQSGYSLAVWNIYLKDRFGYDLIKRVWELMPVNRALFANGIAIAEQGSAFQFELNNFGVWTYFTNYRTKPDEFFEEAAEYPVAAPVTTIEFVPPRKTVFINKCSPASNIFLVFPDYSRGFNDTLVSIITNGDLNSAVNDPLSFSSLTYNLLSSNEDGANKINDYYYSLIESEHASVLRERNIFNNSENPGEFNRFEIDYAYPQPFNYSEHQYLFIPAAGGLAVKADLSVFSSSMRLVYSAEKDIFALDKIVVKWDGKDNAGNKLPSGVYIYATKAGDSIKKGKLVILNE